MARYRDAADLAAQAAADAEILAKTELDAATEAEVKAAEEQKAKEEAAKAKANTPAKAKIIKVKPAKKAMTVTWKKVGKASGYRIQYALDKKFKKSLKTKKVKKYTKKGLKIKKLKSKKTYYVRVQAYRTVGGKTYYGKWSTLKKVKIK